MRVIKQREIIDDSWQLAPPGAPVPNDGDLIIGLTEWNASPEAHAARAGKTGVLLKAGEEPEDVLDREENGEAPLQGTKGRGGTCPYRRDTLQHHDDDAICKAVALRACGFNRQPRLAYPTRPG